MFELQITSNFICFQTKISLQKIGSISVSQIIDFSVNAISKYCLWSSNCIFIISLDIVFFGDPQSSLEFHRVPQVSLWFGSQNVTRVYIVPQRSKGLLRIPYFSQFLCAVLVFSLVSCSCRLKSQRVFSLVECTNIGMSKTNCPLSK